MKRIFVVTAAIWSMASTLSAAEPVLLDWGSVDTASAGQQEQSRGIRAAARPAVQHKSAAGTVPWIVQFNGVVREEWKTALTEAGAVLHGYIPENAFLVEATPEVIAAIGARKEVFWVGEYLPDYKRARAVRSALAQRMDGTREFNVLLFNPADAGRMAQAIAALPGCRVLLSESMTDRGLVRASLTASAVEEITGWGEVEWVEPHLPRRLWNDVAVRANKMNVTNAWNLLGLTGAGQTLGVCDTGLDTGNTNTVHRDFTNRVRGIALTGGTWADSDGHGTHVAGSVCASGVSSTGKYRGVAYEANLVFQGAGADLSGIPSDLNTLFRQAYTSGVRVHSDSWGYDDAGDYHSDSRSLDMWVWSNKTMLILVAAGNSGIDANSDGVVDTGSVGSPSTAKNCLTVGASENYRTSGGYSTYGWGDAWPSDYPAEPIKSDYISRPDSPHGLAAFSGRGPCTDGRIKPDVVAPGTDIISTRSKNTTDTGWGLVSGNTNYMYMGGTSMATPLTAGAAGLVRQWLVTSGGLTNPSAALIKAMMINGARNMAPGQYGTGATQEIATVRPSNSQGWGHVDVYNTVQPPAGLVLQLHDTNSLATGASNTFVLTVSATTTNKVIVTMAYSDYWAAAGAGKKLVNDLDLTVRKPGGTLLYANGRSSVDATNNVEMIEFAPDETGDYSIRVAGRTVPSGGSQAYALVIRGVSAGAADTLAVSPAASFAASGPQGGPFAPTSTVYALTNSGGSSLTWTAVKGAGLTWLDVSKTNGTLAAGTATSVTFMINSAAASALSTGLYSGTVTFSNQTSGGTLARTASLTARGISQFAWNSISSPQQEGAAFTATITAKDESNATVTAFAGPVALSGVVSATSTVGTATNGWIYPMSTYYHDARAQVIYLQSELGSVTVLQGLGLNVATVPGQSLGNWTIRMKHIAASTQSSWEGPASGWTTVYQGNDTVSSTGWTWFAFSTPFSYNGVSNLLVDFSHNNSSYSTDGQVRASTGAVGRALVYRSDSADGDPLDWSGSTPAPVSTNRMPNIKLVAGASVSLSPTATGAFTNGVWSGLITVNASAASMVLRASTNGITGDSNAFTVDADADLPALTTLAVSNARPTSAMSGGNITSEGSSPVTQRGVCWSTNATPTTNDTKTSNGSGTGSFSSTLTGLTPGRAYYARAYAVNASGVEYGSAVGFSADCFTNAPSGLATGSVSDASFTASWSTLDGASGYRLDVSTNASFQASGGSASDLFFSEYIEGASNEKYIEIYNGTGGNVDLSGYALVLFANGATTPTTSNILSGTITNGTVVIYRNSSATNALGTANSAVNFNGDDALALWKRSSSSWVDIFGRIGEDPGTAWTAGSHSTLDRTLVRKSSVAGGVTSNPGSGFPTLETEWDVYSIGDESHLNSHTFAGGSGPAFVAGYSNRTVAGTSQSVTGLTATTLYYFRVRAVSDGGCVSGNSATQSVTTGGAGLPAWYTDWAAAQGFDPYGPNGGMDDDYDGDGTPNVDEYTGGTGATNGLSEFVVENPEKMSPTQYSLTVDAITGRIYSVYYKTNAVDGVPWSLFKAWTNLGAGEQDLILTNSAILQLYRLGVRLP
ncbi:MAG: S8 family serine peptidase [Kiritimatiellae bacterium]|nr:S8 family serine peptidase [Kiritimatiellia bacterium]